MAIYRGTLYQEPAVDSLGACQNARLAFRNFLAPFGWIETARIAWGTYLGSAIHMKIILTHPKWGSIAFGSNNSGCTTVTLGHSTDPEGSALLMGASNSAPHNAEFSASTEGRPGPNIIYIVTEDYYLIHMANTVGAPITGEASIGNIAGKKFFPGQNASLYNNDLTKAPLYLPSTRYLSTLPEGGDIALSQYAFRTVSPTTTGFTSPIIVPKFHTYSYANILGVGEYIINGKRYYQFSRWCCNLMEL